MPPTLSEIGMPLIVMAYRDMDDQEAVLVQGTLGTARFTGMEWGYCGEATKKVVELLMQLGIHQERAEHIVFNSVRHEEPGVDWIALFLSGNRLLVRAREQLEENDDPHE